ncbi:uncharacterized protein LOC117173856 [Belonocnema kinseyi]|uniref:uncharacterized protein LOC117173856 n=1 Tax=Belonocnema kinseyi TaxID=2817044 RepID=UPI00143D8893|nr:uncharacterized protein LOC117173856 [Belonocnema kinseyi]
MVKTRQDTEINFVGDTSEHFCSRKLPSRKEVLRVFFHHKKLLKQTIRYSSTRTAEKVIAFWNEAGIPVGNKRDIIKKIERLNEKWLKLNMNSRPKAKSKAQFFKELAFKDDLEDLFDIAHVRASTSNFENSEGVEEEIEGRFCCIVYFSKIQCS